MVNKLMLKFFERKITPYWIILLMDCLVVLFSYIGTNYLLNNKISSIILQFDDIFVVFIYAIIFIFANTYKGILRYSSYVDIIRIVIATVVALVVTCSLNIILKSNHIVFLNKESLFLGWIISLFLLCLIRVIVKQIYDDTMRHNKRQKNVLIYGTLEAGVSIGRSIRSSQIDGYVVKGFITDDPKKIGRNILGQRVYSKELTKIPILTEIDAIIVSPLKKEQFLKNQELIDQFINNNIKIMIAPPISDWGNGVLKNKQIKELQIEDLLSRDEITIDLSKIEKQLTDKTILITGAAGSIGSEITYLISKFAPNNLVLIDQSETPMHDIRIFMEKKYPKIKCETIVATITNQTRMEYIFNMYKPSIVFHAAAYKHVPMMEDNVSESIQNNVSGTKIIADLAVKHGVEKFVMISTDKAVNPTNVMGCSKRICEIYVQSLNTYIRKTSNSMTQFITTRFGNVLGSNGSVIPLFKKQIENGGPVTVTHPDIIRYFMTIPEACELVLEAGCIGKGGEIFVFDMGKPVKIVDLAKNMIRLSGVEDVNIVFTGLRDGEKLYEELLNTKENTTKTINDKIMIAKVREYDYTNVSKQINELIELSYSYDEMKIVKCMKSIVSEYMSQNSRFEILDKQN